MPEKPKRSNGSVPALGFEAKLWAADDDLRSNMDAAECKHVVIGLIFLKYISDAFEAKRAELAAQKSQGADPEDRAASIFWMPNEARWQRLKASAIGTLVDDAMAAIERDNPALKGVLPKDYAPPGLDKQCLGQIINLVSDIALGSAADRASDTRPRVRVLLRPLRRRRGQKRRPVLHTLARGARAGRGARAVQGPRLRPPLRPGRHVCAEREVHRGERRQDRPDRARRHLPQRPAPRPQGRLRAGQPAFNDSDWRGELLKDDQRCACGTPPAGSANYAWVQHFIHHSAPTGLTGFVLANGSMSSSQPGEGEICHEMKAEAA